MRGAVDREAQGERGGGYSDVVLRGNARTSWSRKDICPVRYCSCLSEENALRCGTLLCFFLWPALTGTDFAFHAIHRVFPSVVNRHNLRN